MASARRQWKGGREREEGGRGRTRDFEEVSELFGEVQRAEVGRVGEAAWLVAGGDVVEAVRERGSLG